MNSGLIGLLVTILLINFGARIIRALAANKQQPVPGKQKSRTFSPFPPTSGAEEENQDAVPPISEPFKDMVYSKPRLERLSLEEVRHGDRWPPSIDQADARSKTTSLFAEIKKEILSNIGQEDIRERETDGTAGDFEDWEEDRFETTPEIDTSDEEFIPVEQDYQHRSPSGAVKTDEQWSEYEQMLKRAAPSSIRTGILDTLENLQDTRTAITLSFILGPCRAKKRPIHGRFI